MRPGRRFHRVVTNAAPPSGSVVFGPFSFDLETLELTRDGEPTRLQPQPARVLAELIRAEGRLVTREQLRAAVWGERFVDFDQSLNYAVRQIRAALDDAAESPRYVETLPKRGYRFVGTVASPRAKRRWAGRVGAVAAVLVVAALVAKGLSAPASEDETAAARRLPAVAREQFLAAIALLDDPREPRYPRALGMLDSVLAADPGFVPAHLRRAEALLWSGGTTSAKRLLDSLLAAGVGGGRGHRLRGAVALFRDWDPATAEREFVAAVAADPAAGATQHYLAYLRLLTGDTAAARAAIERAIAADPLSPALNGDAGMIFYWMEDFSRAAGLCDRGIELARGARGPLACRFLVAVASGDSARFQAAAALADRDGAPPSVAAAVRQGDLATYLRWDLERLAEQADQGPGTALDIARREMLLGRRDRALLAVERGVTNHSNSLLYLGVEPLLAPLRDEPAFRTAVAATGAPGWRRTPVAAGAGSVPH